MMRLEDLRKNLRTVTVKVHIGTDSQGMEEWEDLTYTYRPAELTPDMQRQLDEKLTGDWKAEWGLTYITRLLATWDLLDGELPYGITLDNLAVLPDYFLGQLIKSISEDMGKARADYLPS